MQPVPASYSAKNATAQRTPIYAVEILDYASPPVTHRFSTHPIPATTTSDYMQLPHGFEAQVIPELGQSSIGNISFVLEDINEDVTQLVMEGIDGSTATVKAGFADITYANFITVFSGIVDSIRLTADLTGYEIALRDAQTLTNRQVFEVTRSPLAEYLAASSPAVVVEDSAEFQDSGYLEINSEWIQYSSKSVTAPVGLPAGAWTDIATDGRLWVACANGLLYRSSNGKDWNECSNYPSSAYESVTVLEGRWVAVNSGGGPTRAVYSDDADFWLNVWNITTTALRKVRASASIGRFLAIGNDAVTFSSNGIDWTDATPPAATMSWRDIAVSEAQQYFAICADAGFSDRIGISEDGENWSAVAIAGPGVHKDWTVIIAYEGGTPLFLAYAASTDDVAQGDSSTTTWALVSPTGITAPWTAGVFISPNITVLVASDGSVQAGGASQTPLSASAWDGLAVGEDDLLVAVSTSGADTMMVSEDNGVTWVDPSTLPAIHRLTIVTRGITLGDTVTTSVPHSPGVLVQEIFPIGPAHPMDIALDRLQLTDKTGVSLDASQIDVTTIGTTLKNAIGSTYTMQFVLREAQNLKQWLETEIYQPLQLYQVPSAGRYSLHQSTVPIVPVATLTHDEIIVSGAQVALNWDGNFRQSLINYVQYQYDFDELAGDYRSTVTFQDAASIARYGKTPLLITSKGLHTSLTGTDDLIASIGDSIITRLRNGTPKIQVEVFLSQHLLEPGDIVALTSTLLPNPITMARGVSGALWEVISRGMVFDQGNVQLTLIWPAWRDIPSAPDRTLLLPASSINETQENPRTRRRTIKDTHLRSGSS